MFLILLHCENGRKPGRPEDPPLAHRGLRLYVPSMGLFRLLSLVVVVVVVVHALPTG